MLYNMVWCRLVCGAVGCSAHNSVVRIYPRFLRMIGPSSRRARLVPLTPQAPESTVGRPMAVYQQGIYVEYSVEYSKYHALNGILVLTVNDCPLLN
eukprot:1054017-Pyramimonas_sp.AAC.1